MENKTCAVICEYNPFHYGHKYQIDELHRRGFNVISIMSGNTVQRGEFALFEKYSRAKCAVEHGADMVVELPFPYSMTSAADFARAGVSIAKRLGVDALAFGCESPELIYDIAGLLRKNGCELKKIVSESKKMSFPKAKQQLIREKLGEKHADAIRQPNNILAVEYIIACGDELATLPLLRDQTKLSATYLRSLDRVEMMENIPKMSEYTAISADKLDTAVMAKLRMSSIDEIAKIYDVAVGTEHRIKKAATEAGSLDELIAMLVNTDHTQARVKRMLRNIFFDVTPEAVHTPPQYTTLLAAKREATYLLGKSEIPIITRTADAGRYPEISEAYRAAVCADSVISLAFEQKIPFYPMKKWLVVSG